MRRLAALVAMTSLCCPAAFAQKAGRTRSTQARELYDAGKKSYNLGDFEKAIETWKEGYELKDDPIFLYNIAQAYRQKGDYQKAIFFYRAYTREEPRAHNRAEVDERIAEMQKLMEASSPTPPREPPEPPPEEPRKPEPSAPPATPPVVEPAQAESSSPHPGRGLKIGGVVTGGAGVAAAAVGVVFFLRSRSIQHDLDAAARSGLPWTADLVDKESQGRTATTLGWVGVSAGIACIVTGATLYYLGARKDAHAARELTIGLSPGGGGISVSFSY